MPSNYSNELFLNRMFTVNKLFRYKIFYMDKTYEVHFCRTRMPKNYHSKMITVFTDKTNIPIMEICQTEEEADNIISKMITSDTYRFQMAPDIKNSFDLMEYFLSMSDNTVVNFIRDTPLLAYFDFFSLSNPRESIFRFYPLESEKEIINSYIKTFKGNSSMKSILKEDLSLETIDKIIEKSENLNKKCKEFYNIIYSKHRDRNDVSDKMNMDEMTTIRSTWVDNKMTSKRMAMYLKTRHNIFGTIICELMDWDIPVVFDVSVISKFSYFGLDSHKTPDYCIDDLDTIYLIDFAVTNKDPSIIRQRKRDKYETLRKGLEKFLNDNGDNRKVKFDAFVWKVSPNFEGQIPHDFSEITMPLTMSEKLKQLYFLELDMQKMENYSKHRVNYEEEDDDEDEANLENLDRYDELISTMIEMSSVDHLKSVDIEYSRDKNINNRKMKTKMLFKDMDYIKELERVKNENERDFEIHLEDMVTEIVEKEEYENNLKKASVYSKSAIKKSIKTVRDLLSEERDYFEAANINEKIPKIFKYPMLNLKRDTQDMLDTPAWFSGNIDGYMDDGTVFINKKFVMDDKKKPEKYIGKGIGASEEDKDIINSIIDEFMKENIDCWSPMSEMAKEFVKEEPYMEKMLKSNMWNYMEWLNDLIMNISYMEGRRYIKDTAHGHSVFKRFNNYYLLISKGSKLTQDKVIRYKVIARKEDTTGFNSMDFFHTWRNSDDFYGMVESTWLTVTATDIKHFVRIREMALAFASDMNDKICENNRTEYQHNINNIMTKSFMVQMIMMMEHKRASSTTGQLNRYLVHSATAVFTNREKLVETINSDPTRTRFDAYLKLCQLDWYENMVDKTEGVWKDRVEKMFKTTTDYDRIKLPSFFDLNEEIEFSQTMNEMYIGNLFDKDSGHAGHREKRVADKMAEQENKFKNVREEKWSKGNFTWDEHKEFLKKPDTYHYFSSSFVASATKDFFKNKVNKIKFKAATMKAMTEVINDAMMMTASLKAGPIESEALDFNKKLVKDKSFMTLMEEVEKMSTNMLIHMVSNLEVVDAIFAMFAKNQIGAAREILIQSVKLRIAVKFFETLSKELCKEHEKEMLTKDRQKSEIMSSHMSEMKMMSTEWLKKGVFSATMSFNADCSRWSPAFDMENFMHCAYNWDMDDRLKNFMCTVIASFSDKMLMVSQSLKDKWDKKPRDQKEFSDEAEWFRRAYYETGSFVELMSGMGQGMLHYFSSIYHCIMDDYSEKIAMKIMEKKYGVIVKPRTLISSDDKTKLMLMAFRDIKDTQKNMNRFIIIMDLLMRCANIHTNWKKSALQWLISEFNSIFGIGKRICWALCKDLYTANMVPDLTSPEEAVIFMLGNMRRLLDHGAYLTTIKVCMKIARHQLIQYYRYDKELLTELMTLFEVEKVSDLPYQLGIMPEKMVLETLIYGPEIHMFNVDKSSKLWKFYSNLYSASSNDKNKISRKIVPFAEVSSGKYWFELPTRLDKKLVEMKDRFYDEKINMKPEDVMKEAEKEAANIHYSRNDMRHYDIYMKNYFMGQKRKYEFQETMVVHSLVRALQLSKSKGILYPKNPQYDVTFNEIKSLKSLKLNSAQNKEAIDHYETEIKEKELFLSSMEMDIMTFAKNMLKMNNDNISSLRLLSGMEEIIKISKEVEDSLNSMTRNIRYTHPIMRTVKFWASDIGVMVSKDDIIDYMFDPSSNPKSSCIETFEHMKKTIMKSNEDATDNPFKFIMDVMKNTEYPVKSFVDFIGYHDKSLRNVTITMLADFPCSGNMKDNMLNIYRSKISPSHLLEDMSFKPKTQEQLDFLSEISMNKIVTNSLNYSIPNKVSSTTHPLERAMYMYKMSSDNKKSTDLDYRRIEYQEFNISSNIKARKWTNMTAIAQAETYLSEKKVAIYIVLNRFMEKNMNVDIMMSIISRFKNEMIQNGFEITYVYKKEFDEKTEMYYKVAIIDYNIELKFDVMKWKMMLSVNSRSGPKATAKLDNEIVFNKAIYTDDYTIDSDSMRKMTMVFDETRTLRDCLEETPNLEELDKMMTEYNILDRDFLTSSMRKTVREGYVEKVRDAAFNMENLTEIMSGLFNNPSDMMISETNMLPTSDLENSMVNTMEDMRRIMQENDNNVFEEETYQVELSKRQSVVKIMDSMITKSIKETLTIYTKPLRDDFREALRSENLKELNIMQNILLTQIRMATRNRLSDTMMIFILCKILKMNTGSLNINLSKEIKPLRSNDLLSSMRRFYVKNKEDEMREKEEQMKAAVEEFDEEDVDMDEDRINKEYMDRLEERKRLDQEEMTEEEQRELEELMRLEEMEEQADDADDEEEEEEEELEEEEMEM